ncbi:23S rRNA (adenine(2503)-C(2))-methyltransferase RlmN [Campylobacter molothri]|uniref:23S rRNA (adenine(2503)-C(2))-methyltransferase RlmN n=1 Tax=Campylobacter molothri TaxID=1032242 RepID=UPI00301C9D0B|nr:23S rRNA (adenine(2503)-C(2))-methyltransferase RlmN [Campylobacter sp. W0067]MBZ7963150.1 23S rRNA (adenine(2503)-C(2))-methyltransferase RlmN [Campylobacter sp. W0049]
MQKSINILDFLPEELENKIQPMFRVKQIYQWIYQKYADSFLEMSSLPKNLREELNKEYYFDAVKCVFKEKSKDESIKYLFELKDGLRIESVLLPMKKEKFNEEGKRIAHAKFTICVSSQVGCKSGCSFCLTAKGGLKRNLSAGEIVAQILYIKKDNQIPYERRINIVYMGMGEPLDNLKNVAKAVKILSCNDGLAISPRRQTISTSGLAKQIKELGKMNLGVLLAISLHAVNDELRTELMPINKAYNIATIMEAVKEFPIDQRKRVMFEYLLIDNINDKIEHAKELVKLLNGIKAKVNLILFNPHEGSLYQRPKLENAIKFQDLLSQKGITCTIRESKGLDISAACGQLKERIKTS